mmetsp:Transcript_6390/g.26873  ORF Transcript_6390/g.26873 Transcript_6390/m.26873 type:complete len:242 (-) Transcript_6390:645-1370(-)
MCWPETAFQNLIVRSAVPAPDARSPRRCGLHAIALTAATCSANLHAGTCFRGFVKPVPAPPPRRPVVVAAEEEARVPRVARASQTRSLLSLPPEASRSPHGDQRSPQTSCRCAAAILVHDGRDEEDASRTSRTQTDRSREPEARTSLPRHDRHPTRDACGPASSSRKTRFLARASQTETPPVRNPTARCVPPAVHATEHTESPGPRSHSSVACVAQPDHNNTREPRPTARTLRADHATRSR